MLTCFQYLRNQREDQQRMELPTPRPAVKTDRLPSGGLLFDQLRAKVANLREAEALGLVAPGTADKLLADVRALVQLDSQ